jgi:hypothetical protein
MPTTGLALFALLAGQVAAVLGEKKLESTHIAGYTPQSNVTSHSLIDLDVKDILTGMKAMSDGGALNDITSGTAWADNAADAAVLKNIYSSGKNSVKGSGAIRSLAGFSTGAATKSSANYDDVGYNPDVDMVNETFFKVANDYWTTHGPNTAGSWADAIITAAFDGSAIGDIDFASTGADFRVEAIGKGIVYLNTLPYVFWEMQDAVNDCMAGTVKANADSVHAWDEAVAFFVGSSVGPIVGGPDGLSTGTSGYLMYTLGEKRCSNYKTCTADTDGDSTLGYSAVNKEIMTLFQAGESAISVNNDDDCAAVLDIKNTLASRALIPLIQGTLRYLYKTQTNPSAKEAGELFAFATAIIPYVDQCNSATADALYNQAWKFSTDVAYVDMKANLEKCYESLGVTCADIGALEEDADWVTCISPTNTQNSPGSNGDAESSTAVAGTSIVVVTLAAAAATSF